MLRHSFTTSMKEKRRKFLPEWLAFENKLKGNAIAYILSVNK